MPHETSSHRRRAMVLLVAAAAAAVLGVGGLFGGVLGELRPEAAPASASPRLELDAALPLGGTAATVRRLERAVRVDPRDADRLGELGLAYQLRWRETGDPSFLPLSERALRASARVAAAGRVRDARARQPRADPPRLPRRARPRSRGTSSCAVRGAALRRGRRRADRARPLPRRRSRRSTGWRR